MSGASSWSFREDDARKIQTILSGFLGESNARTALIVDRTGQMVSTAGESPAFDATAFASLTAADFSANDQLARMLTLLTPGGGEGVFIDGGRPAEHAGLPPATPPDIAALKAVSLAYGAEIVGPPMAPTVRADAAAAR